MDALLSLLALGFGGLLLTTPILALVALVRSNKIGALSRRVDELERELGRLQPKSMGSAPVRARAATITPEQVAPPPQPAAPTPAQPSAPVTVAEATPQVGEPAERSTPPRARIEWERWLGVRGAAVLGGVFLALAGLLFFQYSIQRGWITPALRIWIGVFAGLAAIGGSGVLRRRSYRATADALAGAGAVILYGAVWAAHVLYGLVSLVPALAAMAVVTAGCGWLALRHRSLTIAMFGLLGGLSTPPLLSLGAESALGLFGYLLLLNLGLVTVSGRLRRPVLATLGVVGSLLVQGLWMVSYLTEANLLLALAAMAASALVYTVAGRDRGWLVTQSSALLLPLPFAFFFATQAQLQQHLIPIGLFLLVLQCGALWVARGTKTPALALAAAAGTVVAVLVWIASTGLTTPLSRELALVVTALALPAHAWVRRTGPGRAAHPAAVAITLGLAGAAILALSRSPGLEPWPLLAALVVLGALGTTESARTGAPILLALGAPLVAVGWLAHGVIEPSSSCGHLSALAEPALLVGFALAVLFAASAQRQPGLVAIGRRAAGAAAVLLLASAVLDPDPVLLRIAVTLALACTAVVAAGLTRSATLFAAAVVGASLVQFAVVADAGGHGPALLLVAAQTALFTAAPTTLARGLAPRGLALGTSIAAPLLALPALVPLHASTLAGAHAGLLPLCLAGLVAFVALRSRREELPAHAQVGFAAVGIGLAAFALPVQVDRAILVVGCGLFALGSSVAWKILRLPGLRTLAAILIALTTAAAAERTLALALDPAMYELSGLPVFHWLTYVWLLPALSVLGSGWLLGGKLGQPVALTGLLLLFLWINLELFNLFSHGPVLDFDRNATRELVTSLVWALHAVALLVLGVRRVAVGLRWASLAFLLVTIGKVFLFDLGHLDGLMRVGSLIGLALSLLVVSLVYQRFVFGALRPARA
jgi:uncharacterized membrane protein